MDETDYIVVFAPELGGVHAVDDLVADDGQKHEDGDDDGASNPGGDGVLLPSDLHLQRENTKQMLPTKT
ncbi:hypothetical protein [Geomonas subterranea]|uniref:hypothetical protein n=1 Tax=Geomonas subterranea TaxID=2847989 RepID=UPI001CD6AEF9|nr:hypothetical protein [Geomonas fuzhouensis]